MKRPTLAALGLALAASPGPAQQAPSGVRGDILAQLDAAATKLVQLAEAIPQDKYEWRPGQGVRSVSEVLMHVTGGNFLFPRFLGVRAQSPLPRNAETAVTDKAQVVNHLKTSFEHMRMVIRGLADADLDKPTTLFGQQTTYRNVLLSAVSHAHEHLGQMIAYARMNAIVPPWSAAGQ